LNEKKTFNNEKCRKVPYRKAIGYLNAQSSAQFGNALPYWEVVMLLIFELFYFPFFESYRNQMGFFRVTRNERSEFRVSDYFSL
jgi:hypothetical protein